MKWAAARLGYFAFLGFTMITVVGGYLTVPLVSWYMYGDWRFWKFSPSVWKLNFHVWKMLWLILKGDNGGFMFSVSLTSPPYRAPLRENVYLSKSWQHGASCGSCTNCCTMIKCPILDPQSGLCQGYDSFFWRYFNCGRFPVQQTEIDYFGCPKWMMVPGYGDLQPEPQAAMEALPAAANE